MTARAVTRPSEWSRPFGCAIFLLAAGLAAYANSFWGPFLFDDVSNILLNPSI
jgi:hypothetical protein